MTHSVQVSAVQVASAHFVPFKQVDWTRANRQKKTSAKVWDDVALIRMLRKTTLLSLDVVAERGNEFVISFGYFVLKCLLFFVVEIFLL